jgi:hypothetical protein
MHKTEALAFLVSVSFSLAQASVMGQEYLFFSPIRRYCGMSALAHAQLKPWFGEVEQQIRRAGLRELSPLLEKPLVLAVATDEKGSPAHLEVIYSSGSHALDNKFVALVRKAAPFALPKNSAPQYKAVSIKFTSAADIEVDLFKISTMPRQRIDRSDMETFERFWNRKRSVVFE